MSECPRPAVLMACEEGVLGSAQAELVREHVAECRVCQGLVRDLRTSVDWDGDADAVRRVKHHVDRERGRERNRKLWLWWLAPAACAAGLALTVLAPQPPARLALHVGTANVPRPSWDPRGIAQVEPMPPRVALQDLLVWRGAAAPEAFVRALALYRDGQYERAAEALQGVERAEAKLYRGIALLMLGRDGDASAALAGVPGEDAAWYRAQAALRLERVGPARIELERVCGARGARAEAACGQLRALVAPAVR